MDVVGVGSGVVGEQGGATRLGFAVLLKFFELEGRFPRSAGEVPGSVVRYVAEQVKVVAAEWNAYDWDGRSIKGHRAQIRQSFSFRECSLLDQDNLAGWLATEVCPVEQRPDQLRDALVARGRAERIEPPTPADWNGWPLRRWPCSSRLSASRPLGRLSEGTRMLLNGLVTHDAGGTLALIRADPGRCFVARTVSCLCNRFRDGQRLMRVNLRIDRGRGLRWVAAEPRRCSSLGRCWQRRPWPAGAAIPP